MANLSSLLQIEIEIASATVASSIYYRQIGNTYYEL
jgi:hypothetical protein